MSTQEEARRFYTRPAAMTALGAYASAIDGLPDEIGALVQAVQGLLLHEHMAQPAYGVELSAEQRHESHIRPAEQMLERLAARDARPGVVLPLERRLIGTCRNFSVLFAALLRAKGVPARARCGFGAYFNPGFFEDHWVGEYWNSAQGRWVLVDAQIDAAQRAVLPIDFDPLDVPRDRFVVAGDAWVRCRSGQADPNRFGLSGLNEAGLWWIAGNLLRDVAALNNVELLPWDAWGVMPGPNEEPDAEALALFDRLAALTLAPDERFDELRASYERDARVRVPATVYNAVLQRDDTL